MVHAILPQKDSAIWLRSTFNIRLRADLNVMPCCQCSKNTQSNDTKADMLLPLASCRVWLIKLNLGSPH